MGRHKNTSNIAQNKGWKANGKDGILLAKLLKQKFSAGVTPAAIKDACPQFKRCKNDSFATGLHRMRTKFLLDALPHSKL